jgi:hypothetical protein
MRTQESVALITEYIAWQKCLRDDSPPGDFAKANALALRCMAELPRDVWDRVLEAIRDPTAKGAIDLALWCREKYGSLSPISPEHVVWHAPGIGRKAKEPH